MTKRSGLIAIVALSALGIAAVGTARADSLDPIAVRQAGFSLVGGNFARIRGAVEAKGPIKGLDASAKAIAKWAGVIPSLFPAGSDKGEDTKAKPEIWTDNADFQKDAKDLAAAATKLADAVKAENTAEVAADTKALGEACGACHKKFRAK